MDAGEILNRPSDSVNVVINVVWHVVVDNMVDSLDVQSTLSNGRGNQNWFSTATEVTQCLRALSLFAGSVNLGELSLSNIL